jgi:hypothetical protein
MECINDVEIKAVEAARRRIQRRRKCPRGKSKVDWRVIHEYARDGLFENIPENIFLKYRTNIEMIRSDVVRRSQQAQTKELSKDDADILISKPNI